jgi:thioredoxin 1
MKRGLVFTDADFEEEVLLSRIPVLVEFWGSWCTACKMTEPVIDELADELDGAIKVGKLNVDQNPRIGLLCEITGVPTFILFKNGSAARKLIGARSKKQLLALIESSETGAESY